MHQAFDPDGPTDQGYYIDCGGCGASTNIRFACGEDPRPLLREQWNKRAPSDTALAVAAEREACALVCIGIAKQYHGDGGGHGAERAANAIRIRRSQPDAPLFAEVA